MDRIYQRRCAVNEGAFNDNRILSADAPLALIVFGPFGDPPTNQIDFLLREGIAVVRHSDPFIWISGDLIDDWTPLGVAGIDNEFSVLLPLTVYHVLIGGQLYTTLFAIDVAAGSAAGIVKNGLDVFSVANISGKLVFRWGLLGLRVICVHGLISTTQDQQSTYQQDEGGKTVHNGVGSWCRKRKGHERRALPSVSVLHNQVSG